jgi:hypothetical protein
MSNKGRASDMIAIIVVLTELIIFAIGVIWGVIWLIRYTTTPKNTPTDTPEQPK